MIEFGFKIMDLDLINQIATNKSSNSSEKDLAKSCMLEMCSKCDTQQKLNRLGDLFSNLSDGVLLYDLNKNFLDANKLGYLLLENIHEYNWGKDKFQLLNLPFIEDSFRDIEARESTIIAKTKNNETKILHIVASIVYSPTSEPSGICIVINDVTAVQSQARQLEDMMASLTHDLKTPLIAAETNMRHMLEGYYGDLSSGQKQILELMLSSNAVALKLVKNLLTVFKYETGSHKLIVKAIKTDVLLNNALTVVKPIAKAKNIEIKISINSCDALKCDHFEIERVLTNLSSNAIKFSHNNSSIDLEVSGSGDFVLFKIQDYGIGIPEDKLDNLFKRFWQTRLQEANSTSTGLGLYLSRQIIQAHGGKIWAESKLNHGTTIYFTIPMNLQETL